MPPGRGRRVAREGRAMPDQIVFIPCRLDRRDARSALIEDADGWPRKVVGSLGRFDSRLWAARKWRERPTWKKTLLGPESVACLPPQSRLVRCDLGPVAGRGGNSNG